MQQQSSYASMPASRGYGDSSALTPRNGSSSIAGPSTTTYGFQQPPQRRPVEADFMEVPSRNFTSSNGMSTTSSWQNTSSSTPVNSNISLAGTGRYSPHLRQQAAPSPGQLHGDHHLRRHPYDDDDQSDGFDQVDPADFFVDAQRKQRNSTKTRTELMDELLTNVSVSHKPAPAAPPARESRLLVDQPIPFRNLGNTCYMNATLQCVLHSRGFFDKLMQEEQARGVSSSARRLLGDSVKLVHRDSASIGVNLTSVKSETTKVNAEFSGFGQNDAHEFLYLFGLHGEVNRVRNARYREMVDKDGESDAEAEQRWVGYLLEHDDSIVYDHFGGVLKCATVCTSCGNRTLSFDPILDLSLACPAATASSLADGGDSTTAHSLLQLINNFLAKERLSGANQLVCSKCKKLQDADRSFTVCQWPDHLVLHLKRFNSRGVKSSAPVSLVERFQVEGRRRASFINTSSSSRSQLTTASVQTFQYQLSGIVCHEGSSHGGHYIAYVRRGGGSLSTSAPMPSSASDEWYCCNDSSITRVDRRHVLLSVMKSAYLLFYDVIQ